MREKKYAEIAQIRNAHENYIAKLYSEHDAAVLALKNENVETVRQLQRKQENQMEGIHIFGYNLNS